MKFKELLQELHDTPTQPNPNYWTIVSTNAQVILLEVSLRNQHQVAQDLKMDRMRLSHIMPLLREYATNAQ